MAQSIAPFLFSKPMTLVLDKLKRSLSDEELCFFEADAAALGITELEYMTMLIREGLQAFERGEMEFDLRDIRTFH